MFILAKYTTQHRTLCPMFTGAKEMRSVPPLPSPVIEKKAPPPKVKKMKKRKVRAAKLQKTASANKVSENVEDDEDCSARKCIRPSGLLLQIVCGDNPDLIGRC